MNREIKVKKIKSEEFLLNVVLRTEKPRGLIQIISLTEGEARDLHKKLGEEIVECNL